MHLFLTSSPYQNQVPPGCSLPCVFNESNGFVSLLKARFRPHCACVVVASSPRAYALNDEIAYTLHRVLSWHGMAPSVTTVVDDRNAFDLPQLIAESGMVLLSGRHVPTENAFFQRIGLKALLQGYDGVVMGVSAGSMNCCDPVYAQPEEEGEAIDPEYRRFLPGLALTDVMVLPHYQKVKDSFLDGMRLFEDITLPDSQGRVFYAIPDGSFVLAEDGRTRLCGESWEIKDGILRPFTSAGETAVPLPCRLDAANPSRQENPENPAARWL